MFSGEGKSGRGQRELRVKVRTARGRKLSSTRWLERQLNDPYVRRAKQEGMRGRAAYKLTEIDDKFQILRAGATVVDLGCAPGGWSQVAVERVNALNQNSSKPQGRVYGIDRLDFEPLQGVEFRKMDFMSGAAVEEFQEVSRRIGRCCGFRHGLACDRAFENRPSPHCRTLRISDAFRGRGVETRRDFCFETSDGRRTGRVAAATQNQF